MVLLEPGRQVPDPVDGLRRCGDADVVAELEQLTDRLHLRVADDNRGPLRIGLGDGDQAAAEDAAGQIHPAGAQKSVDVNDRSRSKSLPQVLPDGAEVLVRAQERPLRQCLPRFDAIHVEQSRATVDVGAIIEWVSAVMTLLPGDIILTGTPEGVGPIEDGDTVSVTVDGIGTLSNPVVRKGK